MFDTQTLLLRLADFHLGAMLLLSATLVAGYFLGQPARRLTLAWSAAVAIAVLGVLCCVPGWSMLHVFRAEVRQGTVALPSDFERSLSQAATGFQATPTESFQVAPSTSPSAEIVVKPLAASFAFDPAWAAITVGTLGTLLCSVWLIAGALSAKRIIRAAMPAGERLQNLLREVAGEGTLPRLLVSDRLSVAAAIGLRQPAILLPASFGETATDEDLRGLLAHELAHIRNGDLRLLALWRLLLVALWINPLYWLVRRRMRLDQETLADAVAAEQTNRQEYAERLVGWAREMSTGPGHPRLAGAAGLWENPSQLRRRIAVLLDERFTLLRQCSRRWRAACLLAAGSLAVAVSLVTLSPAEPTIGPIDGSWVRVEALRVRVMDEIGKPIAWAKVTPRALQSSQGHRSWLRGNGKEKTVERLDPFPVVTDSEGFALVSYPHYARHAEKVLTTSVTITVDHPDYAFIDDMHIDVPLDKEESHTIELPQGIPLEVRPTIDGEPVGLDNIYAMWSDGRSWLQGVELKRKLEGVLRIPSMKPGSVSVRLVRLEGETATHFSSSIDFDLQSGESAPIDVSLQPAQTIHGVLSENVPRPVLNGCIISRTLPASNSYPSEQIGWGTWVPIQPDGSFTINGWPAGETLQLIALCDGFHATSGIAPDVVKNPRDPKVDPFTRPQVFESVGDEPIEVAMTPLVRCIVDVVDNKGIPLRNVTIGSSPNVGWWNVGSQIYCKGLLRNERLLKVRDYTQALDKDISLPFHATTNAEGRVVLQIPAGDEELYVKGDEYELPIVLGERRHRIQLTVGETTNVLIKLQPAGTESLGDWDKLAGVVFGCSTREGKRICALPGVQKKMDALRKRMREADNPRDPALLAEAYTAIAEAFDGAGDAEEAAKWRKKAAEQAGKAEKPEVTSTVPDTNQRSIRMRVVDEAGEPIEKAWVGLKLGSTEYFEDRISFNGVYQTKEDGWCTLPIGKELWGSVWVQAKGYALLPPQNEGDDRFSQLNGKILTLRKAKGLGLELHNSLGGRVYVEKVGPDLSSYWIPNDWSGDFGTYSGAVNIELPPNASQEELEIFRNRTPLNMSRGFVPGVAPEEVKQILIASGKSGDIRFWHRFFETLNKNEKSPDKWMEKIGHQRLSESKYRITLPDAGKVRGRVVSNEDGAPLSRPFQLQSRPTGSDGYYGVADVTPDAQGRFEIKRLADGYLKAVFKHKPDEPWRWSISSDLGVRAGTTTELMVTLERGRLLRGKMPLSSNFDGSINPRSPVYFDWGNKNQYGTMTRTVREEGFYSAYVPTGKVRFRCWLGPRNEQGQPKYFIQTEITVPEGEGEFIVPTPDADEISESQPSNGWHVMHKGSGW